MVALIGLPAVMAGIESAVSAKTIGIVLNVPWDGGPFNQVRAPIDIVPDAARELFRSGRDTIETDQMGAFVAMSPGLSQFA
jgi:hypothetical protein